MQDREQSWGKSIIEKENAQGYDILTQISSPRGDAREFRQGENTKIYSCHSFIIHF